jgi:hypothetical protein
MRRTPTAVHVEVFLKSNVDLPASTVFMLMFPCFSRAPVRTSMKHRDNQKATVLSATVADVGQSK